MSLKQKRRWDCAIIAVVLATVGVLAWAHVQKANVTPEELLPADSVLVVRWSGLDSQREAYSQSELHDVIEGSSLGKFIAHVSETVFQAAGVGDGPVREFWDEVFRHGVVGSLAFAADPQPTPIITIVFPRAGEKRRAENLIHLVRGLAENPEVKIVEQDGRTLNVIASRGGEQFVWWAEREHVVLTMASANSELPLAVATGRKPNIRSNAAFKEFQSQGGASPILQIWGDL